MKERLRLPELCCYETTVFLLFIQLKLQTVATTTKRKKEKLTLLLRNGKESVERYVRLFLTIGEFTNKLKK